MCLRDMVICCYSPQKKKKQPKLPPTETEQRSGGLGSSQHPQKLERQLHSAPTKGPYERVTVLDFPRGPAPFSHEITLKTNQRRCQELHGPIDFSHGFKTES